MTRLLMEMRAGLPATDGNDALAAWMVEKGGKDLSRGAASASPFQTLFGVVLGGWLLAKAAIEAARQAENGAADPGYLDGKIKTARFYAENLLGEAAGLAAAVTQGADAVLALSDEQF